MDFDPTETSLILHEGHDDDDHGQMEAADEDHPMWRSERISLTSVGIDIGSSTSHLIFSRLILRRQGISLSSRFVVIKREIVYESPIMLTPYLDKTTIDTDQLNDFIHEAYSRAGLTRNDIDTGALIVTGEAAKKKNAEAIAALFSEEAGKFVCATAGHNLEAMLAAFGSGAVTVSGDDAELTCMNVDIGGGTSKIAVTQGGEVVDTAALEVGARLVALDENQRINRLEDAGARIGKAAGLELGLGDALGEDEKERMAQILSSCLAEVLRRGELSPLTQELMLTPELSFKGRIDVIQFSGGVSEYIYGHETADKGDLGNYVGRHIRERAVELATQESWKLKEPDVRIRATVIGASQYTVQVSGNTIFLSDEALLPLRNLQVVTPQFSQTEPLSTEEVRTAVERSLERFDLVEGDRAVALALHWELGPAYPLIHTLATGVIEAMSRHLTEGQPLVLVFDADIAKLVGNIIDKEIRPGTGVVSIDGIDLKDFDFVDIGAELPEAKAVPVVIKSLIFRHEEWGRGRMLGRHSENSG